MKKLERVAIEAVAGHFSGTWESGSYPPDIYLAIDGKRIAVDIAALKRGAGQDKGTKPSLRFDKVATKLIERLQTAVGETAPNGVTVSLTITAPIRLPSRTAALLEDKIQTALARGSPARDKKDTIHGNRIRIRVLKQVSQSAPGLIGFVHNPDSDPLLLLNMTQEFLSVLSSKAGRRASRLVGDRWLLVISAGGSSWLEAYRYIFSKLRIATGFRKILIMFGDGRLAVLAG